jgi:hypothetical protein
MRPKPFTQDEIRILLEGQPNLLKPLAEQEQEFLKRCCCPNCGGSSLSQFVNPGRPFSPGSPLPNMLLKCLQCGAESDPHSKIVLKKPTDE